MLGSIKTFFQQHIYSDDTKVEGGLDRLHVATTALLLEVSAADFDVGADELEVAAQALAQHYSLSGTDVDELIRLTRDELKDAVCLHQFTDLINESLSHEEKLTIVGMLWDIAYADLSIDKYEEHLIRRISDLIYVSPSDFIRAKLKAEGG